MVRWWQQTAEALSAHFRVHVVDLPGYGQCRATCREPEEIAQALLKKCTAQRDLGGLVAGFSRHAHGAASFRYVSKLVTLASSPKFAAGNWRGIQPDVLTAFTDRLVADFQLTIERFMALQTRVAKCAPRCESLNRQCCRPMPNPQSLLAGLRCWPKWICVTSYNTSMCLCCGYMVGWMG